MKKLYIVEGLIIVAILLTGRGATESYDGVVRTSPYVKTLSTISMPDLKKEKPIETIQSGASQPSKQAAPKLAPAKRPTDNPEPVSCPIGTRPTGGGGCKIEPTGCPYGDSVPLDMCGKLETKP